MGDLDNKGDQQIRIRGASLNEAGVSNEDKLLVDSRRAKEFAAVDSLGLPKTSFERKLKDFQFSQSVTQINFKTFIAGSGNVTYPGTQGFLLSSGAAASSSISIQTKQPVKQPTIEGLISRWPIAFSTVGEAGNVRAFGLNDSVDGWCIRLNGTTLEFVQMNSGVETVTLAANWDIPTTPDTNIHLWTIQQKSPAMGDYDIWYGENTLVHSIRSLGTISATQSDKVSLPIRYDNENTSATTDNTLFAPAVTIHAEGSQSVIVTDGARNIDINASRRLNVQAGFTYLMSQDMDIPLNFISQWVKTETGGATFTQPVNTFTAEYNCTTANGDLVEIVYAENNLRQGVGEFSVYESGIRFGLDNPVGNVKEWGYRDTDKLNGVFFRLSGPDFQFVTLKGGVEAVTPLTNAKPNGGTFHNTRIEHLGAGKISGVIINEAGTIVDFAPSAQSLIGSGEKKPFTKMYNTAALASVPSTFENHWVRLLDTSGSSTAIVGKDENNTPRPVATTSTGRLLVSQEPPTAPPDTFQVAPSLRIADSSMSATVDLFYTVTNLRTLVVQRLQGGAGSSNSGTVVELFKDIAGDASALELITKIFLNGSSNQADLNPDTIVGDGTARILLRRRQLGGGSSEVFGRWDGYEFTT